MAMPAGSADDIIFQALVHDRTIEFFERFDKNLNNIDRTAQTGFSRIDSTLQGVGRTAGIVGGAISVLGSKFLDMGLQAVGSLKGYLTEATNLTARVDALGVVVETMGQRAGYTREELEDTEESIKSMGITTQAARQSIAQMIQANIDLAEGAKLARVAQNAAVVAGINSSQAFERLVTAIQKRDIELLRGLGITIDQAEAQKSLEKQLGKTSKEMTQQERQLAFLQEVYKKTEAITGVYENAQESVGKKMTSTARYAEELMLAIGGIFQPALMEQVNFAQEQLKAMAEWFKKNEDAVEDWGEKLGKVTAAALKLLKDVVSYLIRIPEMIESFAVGIAEVVVTLTEGREAVDDMMTSSEELGLTFKRNAILLYALLSQGMYGLNQLMASGTGYISALQKALQGDIDGAIDSLEKAREAGRAFFDEAGYKAAFDEAFVSAGQFLGVLDDVNDGLDETEDAFGAVADEAQDFSDVIADLENDLKDLVDAFHEELAEVALKEMRQAEEDALRLSHSIEDIEERHRDRIQQIIENAQENDKRIAEQYSEQRLDIEKEYQRRLVDIRSEFEYEASELARKRDAIGLLQLMRRNKQQLAEEKKNVDRRKQDAEEDYRKQIKDMDESLQKQLQKAEEARKKDYENLDKSLRRQQELRELHRRWEEEDRRRKFQKELAELGAQYGAVEGLTLSHIQHLLDLYGYQLGGMDAFIAAFSERAAAMGVAGVSAIAAAAGSSMTGMGARTSTAGQGRGASTGMGARSVTRGGTVIGQAGQVSDLLAGLSSMMSFGRGLPAQVPAVAPGRSVDRREVVVHVSGDNMEPYIQRKVANALVEVERNRG